MLKVQMEKIEFQSIREFEDVSIHLHNGINVLQIRNGYGKTTTLKILRWMFTGNENIDPDDFPKYVRKKGVSGHEPGDKSSATLHMNIEKDGESNPWRLTMNFLHREGTCSFETESPAIGGHQEGWKLPTAFSSKFKDKEAFTNLFMFDGEAAADLSKEQDHEQIIAAIREMTGLRGVYQHVDANGFLDQERKSAFSEKNINDLERSFNKTAGAEAELSIHEIKTEGKRDRNKKLIEDLDDMISKHEALEKKIKAQTDSEAELKKLSAQKRKKKVELTTVTADLLNSLGNPANIPGLWDDVMQFNQSLVEAKLPEGVGRVFFIDILEKDSCICGRPMDDDSKEAIQQHSEGYLSDGILTVVNSMQSEIRSSQTSKVDLDELVKRIGDLQYDIVGIDEQISATTDGFDQEAQDQLKNIKILIAEKRKKRDELQRELEEIIETDPAIINEKGWDSEIYTQSGSITTLASRFQKCVNLFSLRKVRKEINKKLADTEPLQQLNVGTDTMKSVVSQALEVVMDRTHRSLEEETQEIFDRIPGKGGDKTIKLEESGFKFYDDLDSEQTGINMGGMLSAAYSFVSSMSKLGSVQIPLVCDSPVTGMDPMTIGGYVQEVWPLFDQMIIFATPGERRNIEDAPDGKAKAALYSEEVSRVTLHREEEDLKGEPQKGRMIVNNDQDWFKDYGAVGASS